MRLRIINPNTTASMTSKIGAAALAVAAPGTEIEAVNPPMGPVSIEGFYDEAFAVPGLLGDIAGHPADGYVIACFDDTGLDAARCITDAPVVGIGEAAFHMASLLATKFGVVTTLARSPARSQRSSTILPNMAWRHVAPACGRPMCPCSNWSVPTRMVAPKYRVKSRWLSKKIAPRRSSWVVPAWPILRQACRQSMACRWSMVLPVP
jgi:hypothetical protein